MSKKQSIVIAWVENTGVKVLDEWERFDGCNYRHKVQLVPEAKACMWLNQGTETDAQAAREYVLANHADAVKTAVFCYPTTEKNPLSRARAEILA